MGTNPELEAANFKTDNLYGTYLHYISKSEENVENDIIARLHYLARWHDEGNFLQHIICKKSKCFDRVF